MSVLSIAVALPSARVAALAAAIPVAGANPFLAAALIGVAFLSSGLSIALGATRFGWRARARRARA